MRLKQDLWRWIKDNARWVMDGWRVWAPVAVVVLVSMAASQLRGSVADRVRYCGLSLQLFGVLSVLWGLREKRRLFNRPSLIEHIGRWLSRRPRWGAKRQGVLVAATGELALSGFGRVSAWRGTTAEAPVEARLAALEANLVTLRTELAETAKELQERMRKANEAVDAERRARDAAATALEKKVEGFGVGGLHVEMTGVFWLVLGVVLATVPGEIAVALMWLEVLALRACWIVFLKMRLMGWFGGTIGVLSKESGAMPYGGYAGDGG